MGRPALLGRAPKQCRSRYLQQLVPGIKTGEWSPEEEEVLVDGHRQFGNQWTLIASMLPGRTETSVKNHYNCTARRCGSARTASRCATTCTAALLQIQRSALPVQLYALSLRI
jgi:myb proto-oncogene protein